MRENEDNRHARGKKDERSGGSGLPTLKTWGRGVSEASAVRSRCPTTRDTAHSTAIYRRYSNGDFLNRVTARITLRAELKNSKIT